MLRGLLNFETRSPKGHFYESKFTIESQSVADKIGIKMTKHVTICMYESLNLILKIVHIIDQPYEFRTDGEIVMSVTST